MTPPDALDLDSIRALADDAEASVVNDLTDHDETRSLIRATRQLCDAVERLTSRVAELETGEPVSLALCGVKGDTVPVADVQKIVTFAVHLATRQKRERPSESPYNCNPGLKPRKGETK